MFSVNVKTSKTGDTDIHMTHAQKRRASTSPLLKKLTLDYDNALLVADDVISCIYVVCRSAIFRMRLSPNLKMMRNRFHFH